jgi:hypothetical protein
MNINIYIKMHRATMKNNLFYLLYFKYYIVIFLCTLEFTLHTFKLENNHFKFLIFYLHFWNVILRVLIQVSLFLVQANTSKTLLYSNSAEFFIQ